MTLPSVEDVEKKIAEQTCLLLGHVIKRTPPRHQFANHTPITVRLTPLIAGVVGAITTAWEGSDIEDVSFDTEAALALVVASQLVASSVKLENGKLISYEEVARKVARDLNVARSSLTPSICTVQGLRAW